MTVNETGGFPMGEQEIIVYGAHWCPDCRRCKQFLGERQIPYRSIDVEKDPEAERFVLEKNQGKRLIPMIVFKFTIVRFLVFFASISICFASANSAWFLRR